MDLPKNIRVFEIRHTIQLSVSIGKHFHTAEITTRV